MRSRHEILTAVMEGEDLDRDQAREVMATILAGEAPVAWIAGFLVALRMKGETPDEIAGFAEAMRSQAVAVPCDSSGLVDTCGTGGDGAGTFNVSTAAAFVAAGAGARVAKHGNRSVSSQCGSADVLEALGVELVLAPEVVGEAIDRIGFGFLFAPAYHRAMRHAAEPRQALATRTIFNVLGPLTNPASAPHQVMGVFAPRWLEPLAKVMRRLGNGRSALVHGLDGLDELTVTGKSQMVLVDQEISWLEVDPRQVGLERHDAASLQGGSAERNAAVIREVLDGRGGGPRDIVILNAAAALWACGRAADLESGCQQAATAIDDGHARDRLAAYVEFTRTRGKGP